MCLDCHSIELYLSNLHFKYIKNQPPQYIQSPPLFIKVAKYHKLWT